MQIGNNFKRGQGCIIDSEVFIGDNVEIGNFAVIEAYTFINRDVRIGHFFVSSGQNYIGTGVTIKQRVTLARKTQVSFNTFIGPHVVTLFTDHEGKETSGVIIGADCYIGASVTI